MDIESAIPVHLESTRSRHKRVPDDYQPPYPSFVARYKPAISHVVMAYFGVQHRGAAPATATEALAEIGRRLTAEAGPSHWDRAHYVDQVGYDNVVSVAYWDDVARFDAWFAAAREAWTGKQRDGIGTFIEVLRPSVARHETLFSSLGRPEGVAAIADGIERGGAGARLLGRYARPHPAVADRRDGAGRCAGADPRWRAAAGSGA
jgi:aldoxime dehydratase